VGGNFIHQDVLDMDARRELYDKIDSCVVHIAKEQLDTQRRADLRQKHNLSPQYVFCPEEQMRQKRVAAMRIQAIVRRRQVKGKVEDQVLWHEEAAAIGEDECIEIGQFSFDTQGGSSNDYKA